MLGSRRGVVGYGAFFVSIGSIVLVAEWVETPTAGSYVQERVELTETMIRPHRQTMKPQWSPWSHASVKLSVSLLESQSGIRDSVLILERCLWPLSGEQVMPRRRSGRDTEVGAATYEVHLAKRWRSSTLTPAVAVRDHDRTLRELREITDAFFFQESNGGSAEMRCTSELQVGSWSKLIGDEKDIDSSVWKRGQSASSPSYPVFVVHVGIEMQGVLFLQ